MKKFYQSIFAAAAIIAAFFAVSCDNGTTTAGGRGDGRFPYPAAAGTVLELTPIGTEDSIYTIVEGDGTAAIPGAGYYLISEVTVTDVKKGTADGKITGLAASSVVHVTWAGGEASSYGGYRAVSSGREITGATKDAAYVVKSYAAASATKILASNGDIDNLTDSSVYSVEPVNANGTLGTTLYKVPSSQKIAAAAGTYVVTQYAVDGTYILFR